MERRHESDAVYEAAELITKTFIQRKDMLASQLEDGRYVAVREPVTQRHLVLHLQGQITLGTYLLRDDSTTTLMVLDSDGENGLKDLADLTAIIEPEGISAYLETSRRGGHLWFFFDSPTSGEKIRFFGKGLLAANNLKDLELFPKQERIGEGPGSCIRLPFGVHRISGKRYPFIHPNGELLATTIREQLAILSNAQTVSEEAILKYSALAPNLETAVRRYTNNGDEKWNRVKERAKAMDFIGAFVPLRKTSSGGVGNCPFHTDTHASFGVNEKGNYWQCFAGCGAGSIIDFWMKWRNIEFPEAVNELADLLGVDK